MTNSGDRDIDDGRQAKRDHETGLRTVDQRMVVRARHHFLSTGDAIGDIPNPLLQSWRRSASHAVSTDGPTEIDILSRAALRTLIESSEALVQASWGEVETLRQDMRAWQGIVALTDPEGRILMRVGNDSFASDADRLALAPGVNWSERLMGTNAIGTALEEGRALTVHGAEHFIDPNAVLSCTAIPILDPHGVILGALDLSTPEAVSHDHLLALLSRAVTQIERNLFQRTCGQWERMSLHSNPYLLGSPQEGLLAFDGDKLVGASKNAIALLDMPWSAVDGLRFGDLFSVQQGSVIRQAAADECIVQTVRGHTLFARMEAPTQRSNRSPQRKKELPDLRATVVPRSPRHPHEILDDLGSEPTVGHIIRRKVRIGNLIHGAEEKDKSGEAVLIVAEGELRCFTSFEGKEMTLFTLSMGDVMILRDHIQVEVQKEGEIYILRHSYFEAALRISGEFAVAVMPVIEHLLRKSIEMIGDMAFHSVKYRLVRLVIDMAETLGHETARGMMIEMRSGGEELATRVGASRQTVSTALAGLTRDGYIQRIGAHSLLVPDLKRLKADMNNWP
ncbi:MAG: helix-turn-helix domain-containing protein [Rhodospirillum sp.]|nr:helix-turn-helix domain-containing protein [Rhodospirillum sp.]